MDKEKMQWNMDLSKLNSLDGLKKIFIDNANAEENFDNNSKPNLSRSKTNFLDLTKKNSAQNFDVNDVEKKRFPIENAAEGIIDGYYYLNLALDQQDRLLKLALEADGLIAKSTGSRCDEDAMGTLRTIAGKSRLLANKKLNQFVGLCEGNIKQEPDEKHPTTLNDLQGFWDLVLIEINNIDDLYGKFDAKNLQKPLKKFTSNCAKSCPEIKRKIQLNKGKSSLKQKDK